jgi:hypothetical protein
MYIVIYTYIYIYIYDMCIVLYIYIYFLCGGAGDLLNTQLAEVATRVFFATSVYFASAFWATPVGTSFRYGALRLDGTRNESSELSHFEVAR